ncbi:MAG: AMP-binding protein [Microthrixaceae bacterium]
MVRVPLELNVATICEAVGVAHPDRECLVFRDRGFTWREVQDRTRRLARVLHDAGLGVHGRFGEVDRWRSVHDHVALYLQNGNEYLEGMLGAWKARCTPFNVNYRYVAEELRYLLDDAGARAVVVHECFAPTLAEVLPTLARPPELVLQVADGSGQDLLPGAVDYEAALAAAAPDLPEELVGGWSGDDLYLCYTGGTTGLPKGAMWRQADFLVAALGVRRRDGTEYEELDEVVAAARGTVRALPAPPLMHGAAHWNALSCWIAGGTVVLQDHPEHFDPADVLDAAARHHATSILFVGDPMARPLVDELRQRPRELPALRHLLSGGAVLSPGLKAELLELLPGITIVDVLGSTESGRQGVSNVRSGGDTRAGFTPAATAVVLDEGRTRVLPPTDDAVGWLAQGGRVPLGYLGDPEKTAALFPEVDGTRYAVPGDRARWRPDGSVELLGRDSVCINTGGEKVFAEEVETAVKTHPAVLDAVVCGRPSERWGEEVVALVQLRPGTDPTDEELRAAAAAHLARYKLPKVLLRRDRLVRSPSGKADYRWARAEAIAAGDGR